MKKNPILLKCLMEEAATVRPQEIPPDILPIMLNIGVNSPFFNGVASRPDHTQESHPYRAETRANGCGNYVGKLDNFRGFRHERQVKIVLIQAEMPDLVKLRSRNPHRFAVSGNEQIPGGHDWKISERTRDSGQGSRLDNICRANQRTSPWCLMLLPVAPGTGTKKATLWNTLQRTRRMNTILLQGEICQHRDADSDRINACEVSQDCPLAGHLSANDVTIRLMSLNSVTTGDVAI